MAVNAIGLSGGRSLHDRGSSGLCVSNLLVIFELCHPAGVSKLLTCWAQVGVKGSMPFELPELF